MAMKQKPFAPELFSLRVNEFGVKSSKIQALVTFPPIRYVQSSIMGCREKGCEFSLDFLPQVSYDLECREKERLLSRLKHGNYEDSKRVSVK